MEKCITGARIWSIASSSWAWNASEAAPPAAPQAEKLSSTAWMLLSRPGSPWYTSTLTRLFNGYVFVT